MKRHSTIEIAAIVCTLLVGGLLFIWGIALSDTVPMEYRSASPGFGWGWEYDYQLGVAEAGRYGAAPWPWPAKATGDDLLLTLGQPLQFEGLKLVYRGLSASDQFRLDVGIMHLDPNVAYPRHFAVTAARRGLMIDDRRFFLQTITPRYLRLRADEK